MSVYCYTIGPDERPDGVLSFSSEKSTRQIAAGVAREQEVESYSIWKQDGSVWQRIDTVKVKT